MRYAPEPGPELLGLLPLPPKKEHAHFDIVPVSLLRDWALGVYQTSFLSPQH